ncbi:non-ribosomal peptide synthase [Pseudomonas asplenii]|uniref:Non-ribosomal peptide synthase n=1 Tax=Pseudomonas asplenii TaxID=53407 RepID=A0A0N0E3P4_9PSED|nr:condensation domain-containing protein [Pseudomonas fuscovaginae]KPA90319.1 non-ribosomal peptide synthase [Pseudomonas fuscovaginae]
MHSRSKPTGFNEQKEKQQFLSELLGQTVAAPSATSHEVEGEPLSNLEAKLLDIWSESFARPVQVEDNYFALGGDSLKSIRISARARRAGLDIAMQDIINHPTVRALAQHLAACATSTSLSIDTVVTAGQAESGIYPSTAAQEGMLYHCLANPQDSLYVSQFSCVLVGALDPGRFETALRLLIKRHPALRTAFPESLRACHSQQIHENVTVMLRYESPDVQTGVTELDQLKRRERELPFEFSLPPLLRICLVRLSAERHLWIWTQHHLIADGRAQECLMIELADLYAGLAIDSALHVEEDPSYRHLLLDTRARARAEQQFWADYLAHVDVTGLLGRQSDVTTPEELSFELSQEITGALGDALVSAQLTMASAFASWFALALAVTFDRRDLLVGLVTSGRHAEHSDYADTVGNLISTLPLRATLNGGRSLKQWTRAMQSSIACLQQRAHDSLPDIKRSIGWPAESALFDAIYVHENHAPVGRLFGVATGLQVEDMQFHINEGYPLVIVCEQAERVRFTLRYQSQVCSSTQAQELISRLQQLCSTWADKASLDLSKVVELIR